VGSVALVIDGLSHRLVSGSVSLSNIANRSVGPWIISASGTLSLAATDLSVYFSNSFLDPKETLVGSVSYDYLLNFDGTKIGAYVSGNRTRPDPDLSDADRDDKGINVGVYFDQPSYRRAGLSITTKLAYDYSRRNTVSVNTGEVLTEGESHIVSLGFLSTYRSPFASYTSLNMRVRQGLTEGGGPDNGVESGTGAFQRRATWLTADIVHVQSLLPEQGWQPRLSLFLSGQGQYAFDALTNNQRIAFGNSSIGRGFSSGRISGDLGWGLTTELRASWSGLGRFGDRTLIQEFTLYGFLDYAQTFYNNKSVDLERRRELRSTGLGARIRFMDVLYVDFTWARALNNPFQHPISTGFGLIMLPTGGVSFGQAPQGVDTTDKGSDDFLFRLYYNF